MKNIIVIGGSGFLGSHVADQLSISGYNVTIFDFQKSNWLRDDQKFVKGDLLDLKALKTALFGMDIVYHFAALADLNEVKNKPLESAHINIIGTINVLEACKENNISRLIFASSLYVYSRSGSFYKCSKQSAELYITEYNKQYNLNFTILRFGSLYGPRSNNSNGLYRIVKNALQNNQVQFEGTLEAIREYIHVEDAAIASVAILSKEYINESVILSGHEPMYIIDIMNMLSEILNYSEKVQFIENLQTDHYIRTPFAYQTKLARKYTLPKHVDIGEGLVQLIHQIHNENSSSIT
jgi:UDP-glucose 4-epimerase